MIDQACPSARVRNRRLPLRSFAVRSFAVLLCVAAAWPAPARGQEPGTPPQQPASAQNPSPMVEHTRAHERLPTEAPAGRRIQVDAGLPRPVHLFVPAAARGVPGRILVHFHGAAYVAEHAAARAKDPYAVAVVQLGAGSGIYERTFSDPAALDRLLAAIGDSLGSGARSRLVLSAFSAGNGAVRAILREPRHAAAVDGAVLLDGIHTSYVPERTVLAEGGALDTARIAPFVAYARAAAAGEKALLVTHSEIFPGTFASTTETADHLLASLALRRTPVLAWGPMGMQQTSEVRAGRLLLRGFAGNSAPDHIDHFHGLPEFLARLDEL